MTNGNPKRLTAAAYTLAPMIAGVMFFNLVSWVLGSYGEYSARGGDERFVLAVVFLAMAAGIAGALNGTYRFIHTRQIVQPGTWVFLAAACISAELPDRTLSVLPLSVGIDVQLQSASIGINFLGVGLFIAYTLVILPKGNPGTR